jgi:hypothetical protein
MSLTCAIQITKTKLLALWLPVHLILLTPHQAQQLLTSTNMATNSEVSFYSDFSDFTDFNLRLSYF